MKHTLNIWVIGGDMRYARLAQQLAEDGHNVHTFALNSGLKSTPTLISESDLLGADCADCVVLPLSVQRNGILNAPLSQNQHSISSIFQHLSPCQFLCGGQIDAETHAIAQEFDLTLHDYFAQEELMIANAVPTAEGALQLAMEHLPITIHGARVLVLGFGRVGRVTAQRFAALGAEVCVAARRYEQLAWAQTMGLSTTLLGSCSLHGFDLVINTIPALLLGPSELETSAEDCLILDLASKPGGDGVPFEQVFPFLTASVSSATLSS